MSKLSALRATRIVRDAGGKIVGRTRLQKIAYLLTVTGLEEGFRFAYKHYGPYSEELAQAAEDASLLGHLREEQHQADWGGIYSIYSAGTDSSDEPPLPARRRILDATVKADAVVLELAATAILLAKEGHSSPWDETERRKPEKAEGGRIGKAKELYLQLKKIETPIALPEIA
ncbi:hypothetical protein [Inquilinus limosus]|uniref:hypothetical protein n=1 Tax=Inquilinus limosus TaxID=171674 RepID=UPI00047BF2EC|nr:hypothetical protein [Inquilinus limosus]